MLHPRPCFIFKSATRTRGRIPDSRAVEPGNPQVSIDRRRVRHGRVHSANPSQDGETPRLSLPVLFFCVAGLIRFSHQTLTGNYSSVHRVSGCFETGSAVSSQLVNHHSANCLSAKSRMRICNCARKARPFRLRNWLKRCRSFERRFSRSCRSWCFSIAI